MTYKLTGLEPYQIPSNADLGTMAYQNAEAIQVGLVNVSNTLTVSGLVAPLTVGYSQASASTLLYLNQVPTNINIGGTASGTNIPANTTVASFTSGFSTYQPTYTGTTATTVVAMTSTYGIVASMAVGGTGITYGTLVSSISSTGVPVSYLATSSTVATNTIWVGTTTGVSVNSMVIGAGINTGTLVTGISANTYVTVNQPATTTLGQPVTFAPTVTLSSAITANTLTQNLLFFPTVTLSQATSAAIPQGYAVNFYYTSTNATNAALVIGAGGLGVTGNSYFANGVYATNFYGTASTATNHVGGYVNATTGVFSGITTVTNTTAATSTITGALQVVGGIGVGGGLYIGGTTSTFSGNLYVGPIPSPYYSVAPLNMTNSLTGNVKTQLNLINTGGSAGAGSAIDFYTYTDQATSTAPGARVSAIDDGSFSASWNFYTKIPGAAANLLASRLTISSTGTVTISSTASTVSTNTGALQVAGGVGIAGGLYVGGTVTATTLVTTGTASVIASGASTNANAQVTINNNTIYNQAPVNTGTNLYIFGGSNQNGVGAPNILIQSVGNGAPYNPQIQMVSQQDGGAFGPLGVINFMGLVGGKNQSAASIIGYSPTSGGTTVPGGLRFYTNNGATTTTTFPITTLSLQIDQNGNATFYSTSATNSTNTGALQVAGGVGIAGGLYVGGVVTATAFVGTFAGSVAGVSSTATNLQNGSAGAIPYQSAPGVTTFATISTAGYVLQSSGAVPRWVDIGPTVLNDISSQFDGSKTVFNLRLDQTVINNIVDSKDLEVVIGGQRLAPYVDILPYPWLTPYDSYKGFRVKNTTSTGQIVIYNAPYRGDTAVLTVRAQTTTRQKRKYPYSATTIAFGD